MERACNTGGLKEISCDFTSKPIPDSSDIVILDKTGREA